MKIKMLPALAGDCIEIFFEDPKPRLIIIDGGMGKMCKTILKNDVFDWGLKNGPVDLAILTHVDHDHISGFISLVSDKRFDSNSLTEMWFNYGDKIEGSIEKPLSRIYIKDDSCQTSIRQGRDLYQVLASKSIQLIAPVTSGMVKMYGKYKIEVISPSKECLKSYVNSSEYEIYSDDMTEIQTATRKKDYKLSIEELAAVKFDGGNVTNANASSISVLISGDNIRILCLADAKPSEVERELRNRGFNEENPLVLNFLKVSHHGSAHNTSDSLIKIIDCSNYLISTNWRGLPTKECLTRIVVNSKKPVTFWCNYEPDTKIFTKAEYERYKMRFKYIENMEIEISGDEV